MIARADSTSKRLEEEGRYEMERYGVKEGNMNYCIAETKASIARNTAGNYAGTLYFGDPDTPGEGLTVRIKEENGLFNVTARDAGGAENTATFTRSEMLSMYRDEFEEKVIDPVMDAEKRKEIYEAPRTNGMEIDFESNEDFRETV